jgi:hypothetical protein
MLGLEMKKGDVTTLEVVFPPAVDDRGVQTENRYAVAHVRGLDEEDPRAFVHIPGRIDGRRVFADMTLRATVALHAPTAAVYSTEDLNYEILVHEEQSEELVEPTTGAVVVSTRADQIA